MATLLFQLVWSEEDELTLLRGMIKYKAQKGVEPYANLGDFYEFVKKAFHFDASSNQFVAKMKRLKGQYRRNAANSKLLVFSNPHEVKLFELSKYIWEVDPSSMRPLMKAKSERVWIEENEKVAKMMNEHPLLNALLMDELRSIRKGLMDEMETEWKKLKQDEMDLLAKKDALIAKHIRWVLDGIKY